MRASLARSAPIELTADPRFARRVKRLAATSVVALGGIWALAVATLSVPPAVHASLAAGWVLMPATLVASLARPRLRLALVLPASLVGVPLVAIVAFWLPGAPVAAAGWVLMTLGVAMGGALGAWFWFRMLPVPAAFDDPYSAGRLALIAIHVGLIVAGIALVAIAATVAAG
jgi:hypothetical protein